MIRVRNLTKRYVRNAAVDDISFDVGKGEIVGFLGPNGAGKSTTMRILTGYLPATQGSVEVAGHDIFRESLQARKKIGYMPENVPLYTDMRVKEYLRFRGALKGLSGKELREKVGDAMSLAGVTEVRRKLIGALSKGYRQRVGLADALVHSPPLLILDEPTNGLDPNQIRQIRDLIKHLGQNHTILLSTHILHEVEMVCDRVIIIDRGKVRATGSPESLVGEFRAAGQLALEIEAPAREAMEALKSIQGVRKVVKTDAADGWVSFAIKVESNSDVREKIADLALGKKWRIRELTRLSASLEDVFVELTHADVTH